MARIHVPACFSLDERIVPKLINDGKQLLSSLESVKVRLENLDLHQETREIKANRCRLIREISRLYSCIRDCLELMERPRIMTRKLFLWNTERGTTRNFRLLRADANHVIADCESVLQNPSCPKDDDHSTPQTNLVAANPRTANDLCSSMEDQVVAALLKEEESAVVCIWGKRDRGKTTLAKNIFFNRLVRQHFEVFAWDSQKPAGKRWDDFTGRILVQLIPDWNAADIRDSARRTQMAVQISKRQEEKRCLVVLDDISTVDNLKHITFPSGGSISKYLITTPSEDVAQAVATEHGAHRVLEMPPLAEDECFNMLKEKANFDDQELLSVGKAVFRVCGDSPLLALVLGISLKKMDVPSRDQLIHQLDSLQIANQVGGGEAEILALIFDRFPHELKSFLLYMGQFPQGQYIQIEKLYLLLAAEDLVMPPDNLASGKKILNELTERMLVEEVTSMYKYCRLRMQIRDFCISQGMHEEYFNIVDMNGGIYVGNSANKLAIYLSENQDYRIGRINKRRICSLLIFGSINLCSHRLRPPLWPPELIDLTDFIFLRVLDFHGVDFSVVQLPTGIDKLSLLRYLSFQGCDLQTFPSSFSKLQCLETLDLRTKFMIIPNVLNDMKRLRHLFFPMEYESADNCKLQLHCLQMLEILVNFDSGVCKVDDLFSLKNILILTVVSQDIDALDGVIQYSEERAASNMQLSVNIKRFHRYSAGRVPRLKNLLESKCIHSVCIEGVMGPKLPKDVRFSPNISEIVFDGSELEDDQLLNVLGSLENLRSLSLLKDAFKAKEMTFSTGSWFNLRILILHHFRLLEKITFEQGAMPALSTLVVESCKDLKMIVMPRILDSRLKHAMGNDEDHLYSVIPLPDLID